MKITMGLTTNLKIKEAKDKIDDSGRKALKDAVRDIANDAIKSSPVDTGHNRRSIAYCIGRKVTKTGHPKSGEKPFYDYDFNLGENEGAIYSTSGYGGYLETGTVKMGPRPYFKPALDRNIKNLPKEIKAHLGA